MGTEVYLGMPPANIEQWIEKEYLKKYLTIYKVQTTSQYKKTGIYSAQRDDTSKSVRIDWGDGAIEEVDGDVSQKVHEYSDVGEFTVKVSNIKTFDASAPDSTWYNTTSQNRRTLKELVNLNEAVTRIGYEAFYNCSGLTSVTIPDSVTGIWSKAFYNCSGLTSVTIPDSVPSIGGAAFYGCIRLTSVTIGNGVTSIGDNAFDSCSSLTSVTIPNSVTDIWYSAFYNCSGLTSVTIPDSVTNIWGGAFSGCRGLTSVTIGNGVTSIGDNAFSGCRGLMSVTFDGASVPAGNLECFNNTSNLNDVYMLNISISDVQAQLDDNISNWGLGVNDDGTYHTVTIHCMDGEVVIDPTPSGSSSSSS